MVRSPGTPTLVLLMWACALPLSAQERADSTSLSIVSGLVLDEESGGPVPGATVSLRRYGAPDGFAGSRVTGNDGRFSFEGIASGDYVLGLTGIGYHPLTDSTSVPPGSHVRIAARLSVSPLALEPIVAVSPRRPAFMDGFEERRAQAGRHAGFFTREEIEERSPRDISELVRSVPGNFNEASLFGQRIRVVGNVASRRRCSPPVFVNGIYTPVAYDDLYSPEDIAAVELYTIDHETPSRFKRDYPLTCGGALVIWLREPEPWEEPDGPP